MVQAQLLMMGSVAKVTPGESVCHDLAVAGGGVDEVLELWAASAPALAGANVQAAVGGRHEAPIAHDGHACVGRARREPMTLVQPQGGRLEAGRLGLARLRRRRRRRSRRARRSRGGADHRGGRPCPEKSCASARTRGRRNRRPERWRPGSCGDAAEGETHVASEEARNFLGAEYQEEHVAPAQHQIAQKSRHRPTGQERAQGGHGESPEDLPCTGMISRMVTSSSAGILAGEDGVGRDAPGGTGLVRGVDIIVLVVLAGNLAKVEEVHRDRVVNGLRGTPVEYNVRGASANDDDAPW